MTEIEKLEARIDAVAAAIDAIKHAAVVDRKMSHDKHVDGHFTKALTEMAGLSSSLNALKKRIEAIGR